MTNVPDGPFMATRENISQEESTTTTVNVHQDSRTLRVSLLEVSRGGGARGEARASALKDLLETLGRAVIGP